MFVFTLVEDGNYWKFKDANGVFVGTDAAKQMQQNGGTMTWSIEFDENGGITISSTDTDCGSIQYNSGSPRFLNYTSAQSAIDLYKYLAPSSEKEFVVSEELYDAVETATSYFSFDSQGKINFVEEKTWSDVESAFEEVEEQQLTFMETAIGKDDGNFVEQFIKKYDRAVGFFGCDNYGRKEK